MDITQRQAKLTLNHVIKINKSSMESDYIKTGSKYGKKKIIDAMILLSKLPSKEAEKVKRELKRQQNINNGKPERHGFTWTDKEINLLYEECRKNLSIKKIVQKHKRTQGAIISQMPIKYRIYYDLDTYLNFIEKYPEKEDEINKFRLQFISHKSK